MFPATGQTVPQQYPAGRQVRGKNEFINNNFHQFPRSSVSIRVLQNIFFSSEFISRKNQATEQCRQSETFCKELPKSDKQYYNPG